MATPTRSRARTNTATFGDQVRSSPAMMNTEELTRSVPFRPAESERREATNAPISEPIVVEVTMSPCTAGRVSSVNSGTMKSKAPPITPAL
eukprot:5962697-Pleurochrysis_carterae.AAC.1